MKQMPFSRFAPFAALALALAVAACGGDAPTDVPSRPGIAVLAGAGVSDTVLAQPAQALVLEVRGDDGKPAAGVTVRFEPQLPADSLRLAERGVYVCALDTPTCDGAAADRGLFVAQTTDAAGRAKVAIRLGTVAGRAVVRLSAPELGLVDSASYTVLPGAATRVRLGVRDTALVLGNAYAPHAAVRDRFGNARTDAPTLGVDSHLELRTGGAVGGARVGTGRVVARFGAFVDSATVVVVPTGVIAAYEAVGPFGDAIVTANLDGSGLRRVSTQFGSDAGGWPTWSPDGARLVFHAGAPQELWVADTSFRRRLTTSSRIELYPRYSADGAWVYHSTTVPVALGIMDYVIVRVRADGGGAEQLTAPSYDMDFGSDLQPDPSPDGTRVVYTSAHDNVSSLIVLDLATRRSTVIGPTCSGPRWSPDGSQIACVAGGGVVVMRADGSGRRTIAGGSFVDEANWSPDGRWIIARSNGLVVVDAATGETSRLPFGQNWFQPVFRR